MTHISLEQILEHWKTMEPWDNADYIPSIPIVDANTYQEIIIPNIIRCGGIPKSELIINAEYLGSCRNSSTAIWKGDHFEYLRRKYSTSYIDEINHFEDDDGSDLFIPIKLIKHLNNMRAIDIKFGNYLKHNGRIIQVSTLSRKKVGYHIVSCHLSYARLHELEGIELTHKFLKDNGFIHHGSNLYKFPLEYGDFMVCIDMDSSPYLTLHIGHENIVSPSNASVRVWACYHIRYIHQLQNILSDIGHKEKAEHLYIGNYEHEN